MNKEKFIEKQICKFKKEFKLKRSIEMKIDNRLGNDKIMGVDIYRYLDNNEPFYLIKCNMKILKRFSKNKINHVLLHEFGHLKLGHVGLDKIRCNLVLETKEYQAEKFAMLYLKKHYPKYYQFALKDLKGFQTHEIKVYRKAFTKLWWELNGRNN